MGFSIRKKVEMDGKTLHLLMTDGSSEILEYGLSEEVKVDEMIDILNANTDSNWVYSKVKIG